jgi:hypothetical protein
VDLRAELPGLVAKILGRTDPMKIYFVEDDNKDEYDSEAAEIASGLQSCGSAADCLNLVYGVFSRKFHPVAGAPERYVETADEVWRLRSSLAARLDGLE